MWMPHVLAARVCWERLAIQTTDCLRLSKFNSDHPWCQVPPNVRKDRLLHHETHFGTPSTTPATTHQGIASTWQEQMESGRLNDNPLWMEFARLEKSMANHHQERDLEWIQPIPKPNSQVMFAVFAIFDPCVHILSGIFDMFSSAFDCHKNHKQKP